MLVERGGLTLALTLVAFVLAIGAGYRWASQRHGGAAASSTGPSSAGR